MRRQQSFLVLLVWSGLVGMIAGCGGEVSSRAAVKGTVTVDGAPLPQGSIEFTPLDPHHGQTAGAAIENGQYAIAADKGLFAGDYKVQIRADRPTGKKVWDGIGNERWPASKKNFVDVMEPYIPARYNSRSTLTAKIERGKVNECNYTLQLGKK
jgi:hypothetical protein